MRFSQLCRKQVINVKDGSIVGRVKDVEFQEDKLCVVVFYISDCGSLVNRFFPWLFPVEELELSLNDIVSIGEDVILVKITC